MVDHRMIFREIVECCARHPDKITYDEAKLKAASQREDTMVAYVKERISAANG